MCAMTADERVSSSDPLDDDSQETPRPRGSGMGRLFVIVLGLGLLVLAGLGVYVKFFSDVGSDAGRHLLTTPVKRGDMVITVIEDGNVESAKNIELKCEVPGPITILDIIPDGTHVEKGDRLVQLDSSTIEDQVNSQLILVANAEAKKITEERNHAAAKIAVDEYREGTFIQGMEQCEANITIARQNLSTAENNLHYTEKMARKGYATPLDLESKKYAVELCKLNLGVAQTAKTVLEKYTKAKMLEQLSSVRDSAAAMMKSATAQFDLENAKLERLQRQMTKCVVTAPQSGMVVYANDAGNSRGGSQQGPKIDLGASVNEFQAILRLPDLSNMQVKALVHESKVDRLRRGMRAVIKIQDRELQGAIASIANQPEPGSWFTGNIKEYATIIKIDGHPEELKPGMTAAVEILVDERKDVLSVPVQCVVEKGNKFFAWVKTPKGVERRDVVLGATNDTEIEVKDGLKLNELVLQNPRAEIPDAREDVAAAEGVDVKKKFGDVAPGSLGPSPGGPRGPNAPGGAMAGGPGDFGGQGPGEPGGGGGPGRERGQGGRGGRGGRSFAMPAFAAMDKNKDGKVTADEMPEQMQRGFSRMDANGDGGIDQAEHQAAVDRMKQMQQQMQQGGGPGGPGGGPPGGGPPGASGGGGR
jgi:HlyD family secretion protein